MFFNWLLCSCFLLFVAVGDSQGNQQIESNAATLLDHEIYPHHSMMHSLLHKLQGYHPEKDLPQSNITKWFISNPMVFNLIDFEIRLAYNPKEIIVSDLLSDWLFVSVKSWPNVLCSQNWAHWKTPFTRHNRIIYIEMAWKSTVHYSTQLVNSYIQIFIFFSFSDNNAHLFITSFWFLQACWIKQ